MPIDVVYTWVNGSDPRLLWELRRLKTHMEVQINETRCALSENILLNKENVIQVFLPHTQIKGFFHIAHTHHLLGCTCAFCWL